MRRIIGYFRKARAAFTLMEVNLAVFIMAVGVLAMASLYPLGFRESQQSRDDVHAAITANEVLGQLTAALSSRNITWDHWVKAVSEAVKVTGGDSDSDDNNPKKAWSFYLENKNKLYKVKSRDEVNRLATAVFTALASAADGISWSPDKKYAHGLVVQWGRRMVATGPKKSESRNDYSRVSISFRMSRRPGALMAAPIYYTEVHFQGDYGDQKDTK